MALKAGNSCTKFLQDYRCMRLLNRNSLSNITLSKDSKNDNQVFRTHKCGQVNKASIGDRVKVAGWLEHKRGKQFFTLRDASGSCQILVGSPVKLPEKESIVQVEGIIQSRPDGNKNLALDTGDIEILSKNIMTLNECKHLPFPVNDYKTTREELRMRYRYIDIRSKKMQHNLRLRSSFLLQLRKFLCEDRGFVDVETPTLFKRTPGGAQEFIVPTQSPGDFYSLPQSPQQFKQLLMVGAIDRYMQIAKCYRDEKSKPERQPEFTQLDLELSFTTTSEIKSLVEDMLVSCWPAHLPKLTKPFPRISYHDAMERYGTDKPDTRFDWLIKDLTEELSFLTIFQQNEPIKVKGFCLPRGGDILQPNQIKKVKTVVEDTLSVKIAEIKVEQDTCWKSPITKFIDKSETVVKVNDKLQVKPGDLIFVCAHQDWKIACEALGRCRTLLSKSVIDKEYPLYDTTTFNMLWVEEFPLFELDGDKLVSSHHPFTSPVDEDTNLLHSNPLKVKGQHYDLVLNGSEIGGGSIRIHNADIQTYVLETLLNESSSQMTHLLEALKSGCPPHGGIALGIDRLLAIMCRANSIRDVIAFPKSSEGSDLMSGAPCQVDDSELDLYNISIKYQ